MFMTAADELAGFNIIWPYSKKFPDIIECRILFASAVT